MTKVHHVVWQSDKDNTPLITQLAADQFNVHPAYVTRQELAELVQAGTEALAASPAAAEPHAQRAD